jgi:hypothetical protein
VGALSLRGYFIQPMPSGADFAAAAAAILLAKKSLEQFGRAAQAATFILDREFAPIARGFAAEEASEITNARAFRRHLRLHWDRKNWRAK